MQNNNIKIDILDQTQQILNSLFYKEEQRNQNKHQIQIILKFILIIIKILQKLSIAKRVCLIDSPQSQIVNTNYIKIVNRDKIQQVNSLNKNNAFEKQKSESGALNLNNLSIKAGNNKALKPFNYEKKDELLNLLKLVNKMRIFDTLKSQILEANKNEVCDKVQILNTLNINFIFEKQQSEYQQSNFNIQIEFF
ncbi:hypothetical protein ABPG74_014907 [Tetrahymena malaccensis]